MNCFALCVASVWLLAACSPSAWASGCALGPGYANTVIHPAVSSGPFGDPAMAANGVYGAGEGFQSLDVFSLDRSPDGSLVLSWDGAVVCNGEGPDLAVFENVFFSELAESFFMEPVVVSVSFDGENYESFPHDYLGADEREPDAGVGSAEQSDWVGFAGVHAVFYNETSFNFTTHGVNPVNSAQAGGDAFDLESLPETPLGEELKRRGVRFVKIEAAQTKVNPDSCDEAGNCKNFPFTPNNLNGGFADIDGVYARWLRAVD